ncbi:MAG: S8 family serine peptidase [Woeseiaceae bacterium]|nr:S8 family serine peptidase [Woeseiaceae bacterium]
MNKNTSMKASSIMIRSTGFLVLAAAITVAVVTQRSPGDNAAVQSATMAPTESTVFSGNSEPGATPSRHHDARATQSIAPAEWLSPGASAASQAVEPPLAGTMLAERRLPTPQAARSGTSEAESHTVTPREKMSGPVAALLAAGGNGSAELVVRYSERPELFDDELVAELGGEVLRHYDHLEMRAVRLPVASLEGLASDENVDWLSLDEPVGSMSVSSREAANAPSPTSANFGYTGNGVGIAVLDTGVSRHADLGDNVLQYSFLNGAYPVPDIANGEVVHPNVNGRDDKFGHGTHVAGLIGGSGDYSSNDYKGMAPGATILSLQVLDGDGNGSMSDVMAALDWLMTYGEYFNVRVVNMSLGKGISESNTTDPLVLAVEELWDAGLVVVISAGNDGYAGTMTVNSPGNSRKVITVGSITDNGTGLDFSDDYTSSFSSQGPTIGDYVLKPDLLAPGNRLIGAVDANAKLAKLLSKRLKACKKSDNCGDSTYLELSGTSMAAPLVSSAAALMLEKDPTLTPATVKARLMRSARKIDADPIEAGAGILDADAALNDSGAVSGEALSPLMVFDETTGNVLIEDTAVLWGDELWGGAYLFSYGLDWASGATYTDEDGVTANGYMWTGGISAKGYMWTGGIEAKGYMWTGGLEARSLLDDSSEEGYFLNDDAPQQ